MKKYKIRLILSAIISIISFCFSLEFIMEFYDDIWMLINSIFFRKNEIDFVFDVFTLPFMLVFIGIPVIVFIISTIVFFVSYKAIREDNNNN